MIDRLRFGYVVDFVQWYWQELPLAGIQHGRQRIVVGAVLMVLFSLRPAATRAKSLMDIVLANPRGFCAGVDRAIEIVKRAIETLGAPIYVRHEVVHNRFVVEDLRQRGAVFVEELDEVPAGATVIFSAHGVSQAVRNEAAGRGLKIFDATCPLVTKVHIEVARHCRAGRDVILIGHAGHPEVEGTMGQWQAEAGQGHIYLVEDVEDANHAGGIASPTTSPTPPRPRCRWMRRATSSPP